MVDDHDDLMTYDPARDEAGYLDAKAAAANENGKAILQYWKNRATEVILPPDTVCACLDETGERFVKTYEQCQRCGKFMEKR